MEAAEKAKLEEHIRAKQEEVFNIQREVDAKDEQTRLLQAEVEEARQKHEELMRAAATPQHHHLQETEQDETSDTAANGDVSADLQVCEEHQDPVNDRRTIAERNERLQSQLKALKHDLETTRDAEKETSMDKLHKENVRQGRDKYKTLREIRRGNTKRRVDQFENL